MQKTAQGERQDSKLPGVELLRFISAIAVLIWHYQHFYFVGTNRVNFNPDLQPMHSLFAFFYSYGDLGVQVFWCISGFIFFWKYRELIEARLITAKRFFILRFSRLYPLHLATLFLVAILQLVYTKINHSPFVYDGNDRFHFLLQLFMASNWRGSWGFTFNGPVWSVSVEVLVYFFFYLTLRYCGGSAVINCLVIFACVVASRLGITWHLVECLCLFYAGGLAAIIAKSVESKDAKKITFRVCWALVFFAPITLIFVSNHSARGFSKDDWSWLLVFYAPILCMALSQPVSLSATTHRIVEAAGNMTYSSYLLHFPMQLCVATVCIALGIEIPARSPFFFAGYLLFVLIISRFAFRYFEMPAQDAIRSRFVPSSAFVHGAGNASGAATYRSGQPL